jgi:hypothetical protein
MLAAEGAIELRRDHRQIAVGGAAIRTQNMFKRTNNIYLRMSLSAPGKLLVDLIEIKLLDLLS